MYPEQHLKQQLMRLDFISFGSWCMITFYISDDSHTAAPSQQYRHRLPNLGASHEWLTSYGQIKPLKVRPRLPLLGYNWGSGPVRRSQTLTYCRMRPNEILPQTAGSGSTRHTTPCREPSDPCRMFARDGRTNGPRGEKSLHDHVSMA